MCLETVCSLDQWLIAGFTSGLIRFWKLSDFSLGLELQAHGRPLTALAALPSRGILASVAEDVVLNLWRTQDTSPFIQNIFSEVIGQSALLGVGFDETFNQVKLSAYEQEQLISLPVPREA
jgi:WD40 repeat protein